MAVTRTSREGGRLIRARPVLLLIVGISFFGRICLDAALLAGTLAFAFAGAFAVAVAVYWGTKVARSRRRSTQLPQPADV